MCESIHHMGSDRASIPNANTLGENHRGSGVTFQVWITWDAVIDSACESPIYVCGQYSSSSGIPEI
jgi:hypothetical protein